MRCFDVATLLGRCRTAVGFTDLSDDPFSSLGLFWLSDSDTSVPTRSITVFGLRSFSTHPCIGFPTSLSFFWAQLEFVLPEMNSLISAQTSPPVLLFADFPFSVI